MDFATFLEDVKRSGQYQGQIMHVEELPAREAVYADLNAPVHPRLREALRSAGIHRFYSHQAHAINAAREGGNVVTVTSTASGKTLCYNVPVLDDLLTHPRHRALYLFPTKALAQDQLGKLRGLDLPSVVAATYDGDTPREARARLKRGAHLILTNPDMLSMGILPYHATWSAFLRGLRWIVIDEVHTYRGVFGSHVANVLRRLRRVCEAHGARPQILCSSATIANPGELVRRLTGMDASLVDEDGSPSGPRRFVFWNPPSIASDNSARRSTNMETTSLFSGLVAEGVRTITFARARQSAELILRYTRGALERAGFQLNDKVTSYRAGYHADERRAIEQRLFSGNLLGVVSTNALELGVDIGGLDACILNGYPGTVASTWQQAGRAGRASQESLAVLVAQDNPLDQYLMHRPSYFFGRPHENAIVDPDNLHVLRGHLRAAAYELPLTDADTRFFGLGMALVLKELTENRELAEYDGRWLYAANRYPAGDINIRSASPDACAILEAGTGRSIGTEERTRAYSTLYPGAVYLHMGDSYVVEHLDEGAHAARVVKTDVNYYTQPREWYSVEPLSTVKPEGVGSALKSFGPVRVISQVVGFRRKQHYSDTVLSVEELDMPPQPLDTEAFWFQLPEAVEAALLKRGVDIGAGLHAIEHAAIGLMPLFAMCDRNDIGGVSYARHPVLNRPVVFIHDAYPGGVGIAERCSELLEQLLRATREHIGQCPCADGCPSCIQSPKCGNNNELLDKHAALTILDAILDA